MVGGVSYVSPPGMRAFDPPSPRVIRTVLGGLDSVQARERGLALKVSGIYGLLLIRVAGDPVGSNITYSFSIRGRLVIYTFVSSGLRFAIRTGIPHLYSRVCVCTGVCHCVILGVISIHTKRALHAIGAQADGESPPPHPLFTQPSKSSFFPVH